MLSNGQIVLEQEILGSLFKNEDLIIKAKEKIKPEMFLYSKHMNIYLGILEMVENKMKVELITFLEYHRGKINEMDGVTYVSEIFTCSISDFAFNTKMDLLIDNYKKHLYIEMVSRINEDMSFESIESEIENVKVKIHKCGIRKELEITKQYDDYVKWLYEEERDKGMSTGIRVIDRYIGNLQTGRVVTVFARTGAGKTTFGLQVAANLVLNGYKVIYGSSEMSRREVFTKMASSNAAVAYKSINENTINDSEKSKIAEFMSKIINNKFYVSIENDLDKFINEIKLYKLHNNLDVVFVDYVNKYVDHNDRDLMTNKIGKISGLFKNLAVEENLCVVLIAQANRIVDKKGGDAAVEKLESSDIQDSARIEQDSDQVIGLYRNVKLDDKIYRDKLFRLGKLKYESKNADENPECINAVIIKNRHGERGTCALRWNGRFSRISDF